MNNLGNKIAYYRKSAGLTQEELAGLIFVSNKVVSKWESGVSKPNIEILNALATALHIGIEELLNGQSIISGAPGLPVINCAGPDSRETQGRKTGTKKKKMLLRLAVCASAVIIALAAILPAFLLSKGGGKETNLGALLKALDSSSSEETYSFTCDRTLFTPLGSVYTAFSCYKQKTSSGTEYSIKDDLSTSWYSGGFVFEDNIRFRAAEKDFFKRCGVSPQNVWPVFSKHQRQLFASTEIKRGNDGASAVFEFDVLQSLYETFFSVLTDPEIKPSDNFTVSYIVNKGKIIEIKQSFNAVVEKITVKINNRFKFRYENIAFPELNQNRSVELDYGYGTLSLETINYVNDNVIPFTENGNYTVTTQYDFKSKSKLPYQYSQYASVNGFSAKACFQEGPSHYYYQDEEYTDPAGSNGQVPAEYKTKQKISVPEYRGKYVYMPDNKFYSNTYISSTIETNKPDNQKTIEIYYNQNCWRNFQSYFGYPMYDGSIRMVKETLTFNKAGLLLQRQVFLTRPDENSGVLISREFTQTFAPQATGLIPDDINSYL